jgi:hypothetical protein
MERRSENQDMTTKGKQMKVLITALAVVLYACPGSAEVYHVSSTGADANPGTEAKTFKTISAAASVAGPGDTITVHEGVYRERINPPRGGSSDRKRIVYQAAKGEEVVIKGSEIVKGWIQQERRLVTTEMLGKAKTPDLPYLNSNGTALKIDGDYFCDKRNTMNPYPGPFIEPENAGQSIKVWPKK